MSLHAAQFFYTFLNVKIKKTKTWKSIIVVIIFNITMIYNFIIIYILFIITTISLIIIYYNKSLTWYLFLYFNTSPKYFKLDVIRLVKEIIDTQIRMYPIYVTIKKKFKT